MVTESSRGPAAEGRRAVQQPLGDPGCDPRPFRGAGGSSMLGRMTDQRHSSQTAGVLLTLTAAVSVGTLGPVAAVAYDAGLAPATLSALRAAIGASVLFAIILLGRRPRVS